MHLTLRYSVKTFRHSAFFLTAKRKNPKCVATATLISLSTLTASGVNVAVMIL